jgi:hypothetical protein
MSFFRLIRRQTLRPAWEFTTKGIIWRLQPASGGLIIGEERDLDSKSASFFCIELSVGTPLWKEKSFGQQWWTGIAGVYRDTLLLHGYATPDMPGQKGITGIDCATGKILWEAPELSCVATTGGTIRASRTTPLGRVLCELDRRTGNVIRELGEEAEYGSAGGTDEVLSDTFFPQPLSGEGGAPDLHELAGRAGIAAGTDDTVEYVDLGPNVIFGFYERETGDPPLFHSVLGSVNRAERTVQFRLTVNEGVSFPSPDTFLVAGGVVLFVRGRRTLTAIPLRT